jgi:hypothetical protein
VEGGAGRFRERIPAVALIARANPPFSPHAVTAPTEPSTSRAAPFGQVSGGNHSSSTQNPAMQPARSSAPARHSGVWYLTAIA